MSDERIVEDKVVVKEDAKPKEAAPIVKESQFNESERIPSTWVFDPESDEDTIIAMNGQTQRQFNGPRKLFNELLRGGK